METFLNDWHDGALDFFFFKTPTNLILFKERKKYRAIL